MNKLLLGILCLGPTAINAMAAVESRAYSRDKKDRRFSVLYETPIVEDTESLTDNIDEQGLIEVKNDLEKRRKLTVCELGMANFLLNTMKQISPEAKKSLEARRSKLDWQESLNGILIKEIEEKIQKRERTISDQLREATLGLQELEQDLLGDEIADEIRTNLLRLNHEKEEGVKRASVFGKVSSVEQAQRVVNPVSDARFNSEPILSNKPTVARQFYD